MPELPDWLRAFALLGKHGTEYLVVAVDESGQMYVLVRGEDGAGVLRTVRTDESGRLLMVPRGDSGYYLDVDANGYLTSVIKGDYGGALRTVKLDDAGRMSAFIIDSVDAWGRMLSIGNAELAVRLGSCYTYDQRGRVIVADSFEQGLGKWEEAVGGAASEVALDPTAYGTGQYSVRLVAGTAAGNSAEITYRRGVLPGGGLGFTLAVSLPGTVDRVELNAWLYDGSHYHYGGLRFTDANDDLELRDDTGWVKIADVLIPYRNKRCFSFMKLVFDWNTDKFVRALFNQSEIDLSGYDVKAVASALAPQLVVTISLYSRDGHTDTAYIDDVVFTCGES
jgi:hypothetical protein